MLERVNYFGLQVPQHFWLTESVSAAQSRPTRVLKTRWWLEVRPENLSRSLYLPFFVSWLVPEWLVVSYMGCKGGVFFIFFYFRSLQVFRGPCSERWTPDHEPRPGHQLRVRPDHSGGAAGCRGGLSGQSSTCPERLIKMNSSEC